MHKNIKIGWIGLGVMGQAMCRHLLVAAYPMAIYTRSKEKAGLLVQNGANWCSTPVDVAAVSDVIFTMVGSEQEVRDVYFSEKGLFAGCDSGGRLDGKVFVDMGTTAPGLTGEISRYAEKIGAETIDAPVSGGDVGAKNACLSIMAGANAATLARLLPLFSTLGTVQHMGAVGSGQHTKMCNQIVVAGTMIGVCEALLYAKNAGLDGETLMAAISKGAAGCWTLDNLAPRILKGDYETGFMVQHFIKDLAIAVQEAELMQLDLPGLLLVKSLYEKVHELGHGKCATQALTLALESMSSNKLS